MDALEEQPLPMPATALVHRQLCRLLEEQGWGTMDTSSLLRVLETESEPSVRDAP